MKKVIINERLVDRNKALNPVNLPQMKVIGDLGWMEFANCRGENTDIFFPEKSGGRPANAAKKKFCMACDVRQDCFNYALENHESDGIWGGYGIKSRIRLAKELRLGKITIDQI